MVFTAHAALKRGKCCGAGCRHCPFDHERVSTATRPAKIMVPAVLCASSAATAAEPVGAVLFFSGGKDSFLALRALRRALPAAAKRVVPVTTFDAESRNIAHQEVPIADVVRQAEHLELDLVGVPLMRGGIGGGYARRAAAALDLVRRAYACAPDLQVAFGDLHLEHIKAWRDEHLPAALGVPALTYPLWNEPYDALAADLERSGVPCIISAVGADAADASEFVKGIAVGETRFGREFMARAAAAGCDAFGERGEFHTLAHVWEVPREQALGHDIKGSGGGVQ